MRVAIMSDSHDNIWNMRKAVEIVKTSDVGLLIHAAVYGTLRDCQSARNLQEFRNIQQPAP